jgi:hypothetical protein
MARAASPQSPAHGAMLSPDAPRAKARRTRAAPRAAEWRSGLFWLAGNMRTSRARTHDDAHITRSQSQVGSKLIRQGETPHAKSDQLLLASRRPASGRSGRLVRSGRRRGRLLAPYWRALGGLLGDFLGALLRSGFSGALASGFLRGSLASALLYRGFPSGLLGDDLAGALLGGGLAGRLLSGGLPHGLLRGGFRRRLLSCSFRHCIASLWMFPARAFSARRKSDNESNFVFAQSKRCCGASSACASSSIELSRAATPIRRMRYRAAKQGAAGAIAHR